MKYLIHKIALKHIIAPHGLTDIVHAIEYKNMHKLLLLYGSSGLTAYTLFRTPKILDICFIFFSILHFRTDMPQWGVQNKLSAYIIQTIQSGLLVFSFLLGKSYNIFLFFMCFLHVPKHYKDSYIYMKKYPYFTILLFSMFEFVFPDSTNITRGLVTTFESVVIGHILYHELFVRT
jgi:hypothetical protein